ncbi:hypothetical protein H8Z78_05155 [Dysosmobacter sp. NSJ-60]|nr:hypothetical protein [Dysosmobacter hominis]
MRRPKQFSGLSFLPMKKCSGCSRLDECKGTDLSPFAAKLILWDCESFYFTFKQLEEMEKRPVFDGNLAKHIREMRQYEASHRNIPDLTSPLIVNGTLATELALKFLIYKENGTFDCIHDLKMLYEYLPEPHKTILTDCLCSQAYQSPETLEFQLTNIAKDFETFRYSFEQQYLGYSNFLLDFIRIVCDYALSFKPEYQDKEDDFETEGDQ